VVSSDSIDEGVLAALARCRGEVIAVTAAGVEPVNAHAHVLAERLFQRMPKVAVLGGSVAEVEGSARRFGYRWNGEALSEPRASTPRLVPVEVTIPELCFVRGSEIGRLREREGEGRPWNHTLCELAARQGKLVLHVPELEGRSPPTVAV
jgi:hypothetical protein